MPRKNRRNTKTATQPFRFIAEPLEDRVLLNSAAARLKSAARKSVTLDPAVQPSVAPYIVSINRQSPQVINASSVQFLATFSQPVTGVDASEFSTSADSTVKVAGPISVTSVTTSTYSVTINGIHGSGNLNLSFSDSTHVHNAAGISLVSRTPIPTPMPIAGSTSFSAAFSNDVNGDGILDLIGFDSTANRGAIAIGNGDGTFRAPAAISAVPAGGNISAVGDLNGDGSNDLVVLLSNGDTGIMTNDGHGNFSAPVLLGAKYLLYGVIADFNKDGLPDFVAYSFNGIVTFLGTGSGHFSQQSSSGLTLWGSNLQVVDINADGKLDIISTSGAVPDVLLGQGDGTFTQAPQAPISSMSLAAAFDDVNHDGKLDEILADNNSLGYYPGIGDGTFGNYTSLSTTFGSANQITVADFNGDGINDLLVGNNQNNTLYLGASNSFSFQPIPAAPATSPVRPVFLGDFNQDGRTDYFFPSVYNNQTSGYLTVLNTPKVSFTTTTSVQQTYPHIVSLAKNASETIAGEVDYTLTFSEPVTGVSSTAFSPVVSGSVTAGAIVVTPQSGSVYTVAVKNVAGSGTIAVAFNDNNVIRNAVDNPLLVKDTNNAFVENRVFGITSDGTAATSDFNGDGIPDIVGEGSGTAAALGNGDGTFQQRIPVYLGFAYKLITADVNNDGRPDLIGSGLSSQLTLNLGVGDGSFADLINLDAGTQWDRCDVADINGDGQPDIVTISASRHQIATLMGLGNGTFLASVVTSLGGASPSSLCLGDANGDGIPDALVSIADTGTYLFAGHRDGTFSVPTTPIFADANAGKCWLADLNADQKLDAVILDGAGSHILLGNGDGSFSTDHPLSATFGNVDSSPIADVNGDGFADLIQSGSNQSGFIYLGHGDGTFSAPVVAPSMFAFTGSSLVGDFNRDGRPDIITPTIDNTDMLVFIARNAGLVTPPGIVGSVSQSPLINMTSGNISLAQDSDGTHIDWVSGSQVGQVAISSTAGLTINSTAAMANIQLNYAGGGPLPQVLHLNGTFTVNQLSGSNPLANATLDINGSTIFINYTSVGINPILAIRDYIKNGYNAGQWNGVPTATTGVITSAAAAANQAAGIGYGATPYGLVNLPANVIELRYTLFGDTGLVGSVSFADFMRMTQNYTRTYYETWAQGDFNYDGNVDGGDFNLLQPNYGKTLLAPSPAPVPVMTPIVVAPLTPTPPASTVIDPLPVPGLEDSGKITGSKRGKSERPSRGPRRGKWPNTDIDQESAGVLQSQSGGAVKLVKAGL